jgi:hypothetical protein
MMKGAFLTPPARRVLFRPFWKNKNLIAVNKKILSLISELNDQKTSILPDALLPQIGLKDS